MSSGQCTRAVWGAALLISACGRLGFEVGDETSDAGVDGSSDVGSDAWDDSSTDAADDGALGDASLDATDDGSLDGGDGSLDGGDGSLDGGDPLLVTLDDFAYVGAFRIRVATFGVSSVDYNHGPIAVAPDRHSLFIVGHVDQQAIAEFAIPPLVGGNVIEDLEIVEAPEQDFAFVLGSTTSGNPDGINRIGGIAYVDGELLVNGYVNLETDSRMTTTLVVRDAADLAGSTIDGYFSLEGGVHVSGWASPIPAEWQDELGGSMIAGSTGGHAATASIGPPAFAFDPDDLIGAEASVSTTTLLDYDIDHRLADDRFNDGGDNDLWTVLSTAVHGFIVPGTRTYMTIGNSGGHGPLGICYGCTPVGLDTACEGSYCARDPGDYALYYWLYDVDDLAAVRRGDLERYAVRPYAYGPFPSPFPDTSFGGASFDPTSGLLYVSLRGADREQASLTVAPLIAAYRFR